MINIIFLSQVNSLTFCIPQILLSVAGLSVQPSIKSLGFISSKHWLKIFFFISSYPLVHFIYADAHRDPYLWDSDQYQGLMWRNTQLRGLRRCWLMRNQRIRRSNAGHSQDKFVSAVNSTVLFASSVFVWEHQLASENESTSILDSKQDFSI